MEYGFREWFSCPTCDAQEEVAVLAHGSEIVFECHGCSQKSEYVLGDDVPLRGLDLEAIADADDDVTNN